METENENPHVNVRENTEQNTQLTDYHSHDECSGSENTDMIIDDAGFTLVRSERESTAGNSGPQTGKKGMVEIEKEEQVINSQEAEIKSSSDEDVNAETKSDEGEQNNEQTG